VVTIARDPAFGIDFGTTNSVVAVATRTGTMRPLLDEGGPHPSVVWYGPERTVIGHEAKRNMHGFGQQIGHRFIRSVKKRLGRDRAYDVLAERKPAWEVAAEIFRHLRSHALGLSRDYALDEAVVTVPVLFDGRMRRDIRRAAQAAGIYVTTFVHEPFAAVVGYNRMLGRDLERLPTELILVFDWGGGTLDITLTHSERGRLEELAVGGLIDVAGDRFDEHVEHWALARMLDRAGLHPGEVQPEGRLRDRLVGESERVKIRLSEAEQEVVRVAALAEVDGEPIDMREPLTRADFDGLIRRDVADAIHHVHRVLAEARVEPTDVDRAILIGGSSEIPLLQSEMQRIFGVRAESLGPRSQTIIAEGAATVAQYGFQPFLTRPVQLALADGSQMPVFNRDSIIPLEGAKRLTLFVTDPRDGEARLVVTEQVRRADEGSVQQQTVLPVPVEEGLPRPFNHERVTADFEIDQDLILQISAWGASRQEIASVELHNLTFGLRLQ
jgi:molecular chaperone DnaK (HSP70)